MFILKLYQNKFYYIFTILTATCLFLFLLFIKLDFDLLFNILIDAKITFLLLSILLIFTNFIILALRWHFTLNNNGIIIGRKKVIKLYLASIPISKISPANTGDLIRALYIKNIDKKKASGIVIFENFIDIFVLLLFSIFGSFILKKWILLGLLIFFIFIIFGLFFALNKYTYFIQNNFKNNKILEKISTFFIAFKKIKKDPYFLGGVLAFSAVALIIQIFFIKLLFYSFNNSLPFAIIFILQPIAILASLLPLSLSGIGIREGAMAILYIDYLPITNSIIVGLTHSFIVAIIMPLFLLPLTILFLLKKN